MFVGFVWLGVAGHTSASTLDGKLRAFVVIQDAQDRTFLSRIRGQTGDLAVSIESVTAAAGTQDTVAQQIETAILALQGEPAEVVIWRRGFDVVVWVPQPSSGRLLIRPMADKTAEGEETDASVSTAFETGAVIVRSALIALFAGVPLGEPLAAVASPAPAPLAVQQPLPPPAESTPQRSSGAFVTLAAAGMDDGLGDQAALGGTVKAGIQIDWVSLGVLGELTRTASVNPEGVLYGGSLSRQAIGALVIGRLLEIHRFTADIEAEVGLAVLRLTSKELFVAYEQTQQVSRPFMGGALVARWRVKDEPLAVSLVIGVGLRAVANSPVIYSEAVGVRAMNTLSPRAILGLEFSTKSKTP